MMYTVALVRRTPSAIGLGAVLCLGLAGSTPADRDGQPGDIALFGPGTISTPERYESFGSISRDGTEFYFTTHRQDFGGHKIMVSGLSNGKWSEPQVLRFSGSSNDREPRLSPDGQRLYFSSNRPAVAGQPQGKLDLFMSERDAKTHQWGPAQRLEGSVNTEVHEFCPVVVTDGTLYFISARPGGIKGSEPTEIYNVWRARALDRSGLRFTEPENLGPAINTGLETNVYVTPDGRTMLLSRDGAPDSLGGDDLYMTTFSGGRWEPVRHLPAPINTEKYEYGPSLSPDGRWLFFTSARAGTADIYRAPATILQRQK